jgi:hypothetical protein
MPTHSEEVPVDVKEYKPSFSLPESHVKMETVKQETLRFQYLP